MCTTNELSIHKLCSRAWRLGDSAWRRLHPAQNRCLLSECKKTQTASGRVPDGLRTDSWGPQTLRKTNVFARTVSKTDVLSLLAPQTGLWARLLAPTTASGAQALGLLSPKTACGRPLSVLPSAQDSFGRAF